MSFVKMPSTPQPLFTCLLLVCTCTICRAMRTYNIGVLMASRMDSPFDLERCGPAVDMALEEVNAKFLAPYDVQLAKIQGSYESCSGSHAPGLAADMHFEQRALAFVGPACALALEPVARLAAYWNTPIVTGMGDQPPSGVLAVPSGILGRVHKWKNESTVQSMFKDKSAYPTLTRTSYCQCRLTRVFASIFKRFGWRRAALLLDRSDLFSLTVGRNLEVGLRREVILTVRELDGNEPVECESFLRDVSMYARVVILSVRGPLLRQFLLAAHALGMTRGDWAFLDVEIFQGAYWGAGTWRAGDAADGAARAAYEALLRVSLALPADARYAEFAGAVRERAAQNYNYTFEEGEEVNFFIGAFYDGVYLLGMALNETLAEGGDMRDGGAITRRMWGRDFYGITGHVRIDDNGDRDADYSIMDLDPITGKFEVVAHYYGLNRTYAGVPGKRIHWPGGRRFAPLDEPPCGFHGDGCSTETETMIIYSFLGLAVLFAVIGGFAWLAYRQMRASAELHSTRWKVRPEEVLLEVGKPFGSKIGLEKVNEVLQVALGEAGALVACGALGGSRAVGRYKGERVAVRRVTRRRLDTRLLREIKQVRNVSHENAVRFAGACLEYQPAFVLSEYCAKGSLRDLLANDELRLDWTLRMSLVHDIVKGMTYLHGSELGVHGRLRSSTCLIDGRFVLKLSSFGLRTLTAPPHAAKNERYYYKLLWVAPELVETSTFAGAAASQKGDVYSFAIILDEIAQRAGPYEVERQTMDCKEIVRRVTARQSPPFRPSGPTPDCPQPLRDLMCRCWSDLPDDRPAFDIIKNSIRGYCENFMDDLLRRMEQYANNLESLVEEKTQQLSLEKKRSEELLYQVLPRPVAQQLMAGEMVRPEQFECVTVYFSDIVGFTQLCATSTPMQVVDLLNDLYSTFDAIIDNYDVYKVETIGDAYMVVSGLPQRNGERHAREVCLMALAVREAVRGFAVRHRPGERLEVRAGVHSGPVCAGVVGRRMPHYCLFGDTVNTASRMESTGEPLRIHLSESTRAILSKFGTFVVERRGETEVRGKGPMLTHWLLRCTEPELRAPPAQPPYPLLVPTGPPYKPSDCSSSTATTPI